MNKSDLSRLKVATKNLTKWESSGKAFGHYQVLDQVVTTGKKVDRIYEFWCLLKVLDDLRMNYRIACVSNTRKDLKIFPLGPSPKRGWAYFEIINVNDQSNRFQICYGTEIKLKNAPKTTFAPDISVQTFDATDDPDETMVELIMDAKYKMDSLKALPKNQLDAFIQWVNALKTQNADRLQLKFNILKKLKSNCLLTNGKALIAQEEYCKFNKIKQVEKFDIPSKFIVIG